uniref:Odorant receptor n=1 Tax=Rhyacophila nubila TaxID=1876001 RepID=A0A3G2KX44_9NEOP|nr:odorant receptor OR4 [Rhyacophila nubila]
MSSEKKISSDASTKDLQNDFKLKPLHEMFSYISFAMLCGGILPHYTYLRFWKTYTIFVAGYIFLTFVLIIHCVTIDIKMRDITDIIRQMTIIIPLQIVLTKILLTQYYGGVLASLIEEINGDYEEAKKLPHYLRKIIENGAKEGKIAQKIWVVTAFLVAYSFPFQAFILMLYKNLTINTTQRIMVHEFKIPFFEDMKYTFPVYEIVAIFSTGVTFFCQMVFLGFDGFCLILFTHCIAQLKALQMKLKQLFKNMDGFDEELIQHRLNNIVEHHSKILRFCDRVQTLLSIFFFNLVILTSMQLCVTGFQIMESLESKEIKIEFVIFTLGTVVQVYLPCKYGTILSDASLDVGDAAYFSGWESIPNKKFRMTLVFIIMRSQTPILLTAVGMVPVNISSFSSILHTSWSYFTLLRSTKQ